MSGKVATVATLPAVRAKDAFVRISKNALASTRMLSVGASAQSNLIRVCKLRHDSTTQESASVRINPALEKSERIGSTELGSLVYAEPMMQAPIYASLDTSEGWLNFDMESGACVIGGLLYCGAVFGVLGSDPEETQPSADVAGRERDLRADLVRIIVSAEQESFEHGKDSGFSRELARLIRSKGEVVIRNLQELISSNQVSPETGSEAIRSLASMRYPPVRKAMLGLLQENLAAKSTWLRHAATIGLAILEEPRSAAWIAGALERERFDELRNLMKRVLADLQSMR